jgi:hypothetical protein
MSLPDIYFNEFADQLGTCGKMTTLTFYDSGERRPSTFVLCPRLGELIDGFGDVARGSFGDAYIAKLSPYTYLAPHNGATNISLQAVLPICIPSGKSGVHFENTTITFIEGECCVFDSLARREEWNDSDCECVLFFFSLWHPDISVPERRVLEALHRVIEGHARQLNQRWILNNIHKFTSLQRNLGE